MSNTEWKEITDPEELFKLKREEWEIEYFDSFHTCWVIWNRVTWNEKRKFRARPRQPKMKKVKTLCYINKLSGSIRYRFEGEYMSADWIRQPKLDLEGEIPDEQ